MRHQDETGCAEAALERAFLDECLLDRTERSPGIQSLDGGHAGAVDQKCQRQATRHRDLVDDYRAAAAQTLAAAFTGAKKVEAPKQVDQVVLWTDRGLYRPAVQGK